jgi:hypothetical protein
MKSRTSRLFFIYLGFGLIFNVESAYAQAWQNLFVHAGETKSITVPAGKLIEFLPSGGTPTGSITVKVDFGSANVVPSVGLSSVNPPTSLVGPVTISLACPKTSPYTTPASFAIITYRLRDNQ